VSRVRHGDVFCCGAAGPSAIVELIRSKLLGSGEVGGVLGGVWGQLAAGSCCGVVCCVVFVASIGVVGGNSGLAEYEGGVWEAGGIWNGMRFLGCRLCCHRRWHEHCSLVCQCGEGVAGLGGWGVCLGDSCCRVSSG